MTFEHIIEISTVESIQKEYGLSWGEFYTNCTKEELLLLVYSEVAKNRRLEKHLQNYIDRTISILSKLKAVKRMPKEAKLLLNAWFEG